MISKETYDKVRFAKKYIQNRYESLVQKEQRNQQNWSKLISLINGTSNNAQKITEQIIHQQTIKNRMLRQKDNLKNYKLDRVIGRGAFGEVRVARNLITNQIVAIKRLMKRYVLEKKHIYNAYLQRDVMSKNQSNFLVKLKSTFQDENYLFLVMQFMQGGDILHLLIHKQRLTESQTKFYMAQLILGVQQLHKLNYIHRDIKPDNILIDKKGHIKITDFGLSKYMQNNLKIKPNQYLYEKQNNQKEKLGKMRKLKRLMHLKNKQKMFSKVGTPDYISPQMLTRPHYNNSVDIWAIGVVMFQCLYGYPPFADYDTKAVCHKVVNWVDYFQFPSEIKVSTSAKMLMLGLINQSQKRLSIDQIKKHPFFDNIDWQNVTKMKPPFIPKIQGDLDISNFDQFQQINAWTRSEQFLFQNILKPRVNSEHNINLVINQKKQQKQKPKQIENDSIVYRFRFPGFQFQRQNNDPLELAIKNFQKKLKRQSESKQNKCKDTRSTPKFQKYKTQKTRPSQQIWTPNNKKQNLNVIGLSKSSQRKKQKTQGNFMQEQQNLKSSNKKYQIAKCNKVSVNRLVKFKTETSERRSHKQRIR